MAVSKPLLTPKELADAIGASESSLRRWVDNGQIRMSRTAGGHRRIPVEEAIRFIRESGATLLHPHVLGLDSSLRSVADRQASASDADELFQVLAAGDRQTAKSLLIAWYLEGRTLAELFDGPVREAMHRVGELWAHEPRGILIEHRATEICLEMLRELRALLPPPEPTAPLALGGAPAGDPYLVPSLMAAMIFAEAGYREFNYGGNTPLPLLADAAAEHGAKIVWVSVTGTVESSSLRAQLADVSHRLSNIDARLVIGGRHAEEVRPPGEAKIEIVHSMSELTAIVKRTQPCVTSGDRAPRCTH